MDNRERNYYETGYGKHPNNCNCVGCVNTRFGIVNKKAKQHLGSARPRRSFMPPKWVIKLVLNLIILAGFVFLVWSGRELFTEQQDSLRNPILFISILACWIFAIRVTRSWKFKNISPRFVPTMCSVLAIFAVLSFSGIEPMATYKNSTISGIKNIFTVSPEVAAQREVFNIIRYAIKAFNEGRYDRLEGITTSNSYKTISEQGIFFGFQIANVIDYDLTILYNDLSMYCVRVKGGIKCLLTMTTTSYDYVYIVCEVRNKWIISDVMPYGEYYHKDIEV